MMGQASLIKKNHDQPPLVTYAVSQSENFIFRSQ